MIHTYHICILFSLIYFHCEKVSPFEFVLIVYAVTNWLELTAIAKKKTEIESNMLDIEYWTVDIDCQVSVKKADFYSVEGLHSFEIMNIMLMLSLPMIYDLGKYQVQTQTEFRQYILFKIILTK